MMKNKLFKLMGIIAIMVTIVIWIAYFIIPGTLSLLSKIQMVVWPVWALICMYVAYKPKWFRKKVLLFIPIVFIFISCVHKFDGTIVKDADGNYYKFKGDIGNPSDIYNVEKIDTNIYKVKKF